MEMGYPSEQVGMGAWVTPSPILQRIRSTLSTAYDYWAAVAAGDRNVDGTYTPQGKAKLIEQEVPALVRASGGTLSAEQARAILNRDITPVLIDAKADPSQTGSLNIWPAWMKWGLFGGLGVIAAILILKD